MKVNSNGDLLNEVVEGEIEESHRYRILPKGISLLLAALMLIYAFYFLYSAGFGALPGIEHRSIYIAGGLVFALLLFPMSQRLKKSKWALGLDLFLAVLVILVSIYVFSTFQTYSNRVGFPPTLADVVIGLIAFLLMFEVSRRVIGWGFTSVVILFVIYALAGPWLPEPFTHRGYDLSRFIASFFLTLNGPYGQITGVAADYIMIFILFASFVRFSGTAEFFRDLALIGLGRVRGGSGKIAVVASSLMGMLTGSSLANVASVGSITIPTMKKTGFHPIFAGGIEACSSLGAQIMPPIMGSTVFIMMEILGMSYWEIAKSSLLVGVLFYISIFFMVDFEAAKKNLHGLKDEEIPKLGQTIKQGWYNIIPIAVLIYMISVKGVSPALAGFWGIVASLIVMLVFGRTSNQVGENLRKVKDILEHGVRDSLIVASVVGLASLISGIISVSGLALHLSSIMLDLSGGNLLLLLIITACVSIILGTGVPILVAYSVLAVIVAPALVDMGVNPLAAHLFIFYFGVISAISPPSAPDAFVAAGIAKAPPYKVAWSAMRIANVLYFLPFVFVYNDVLLMNGTFVEVLLAFITAAIGTYSIAAALQGVLLPKVFIPWWERICMFILGILLIIPSLVFSIIGLLFLILIHAVHLLIERKAILSKVS